jgi:MSHA pilin protein MshC
VDCDLALHPFFFGIESTMSAPRARSLWRRSRSAGGFSLVELVSVIVVVGVLAAVAIPRFVGVDTFASRGFADEAIGIVRYAQKTAIAWRATVFVCVSANEVRAIANSNCGAPVTLAHPATNAPLVATAPAGVTVTTAVCPTIATVSFSFDGQGRPSAATTINLCSTIAGDPARQIVVWAETGYVQ